MAKDSPYVADHIAEVIYTEQALRERVQDLGAQITADYVGRELLLVGVLNGVMLFMADLVRAIRLPVRVDFMAISHYRSGTGGGVRITKDLDAPIAGQHVLFVEDVIDTGLTINYFQRALATRRPASLEVCCLFDRPYRRLVNIPVAYRGFELPDRFVVGYGLDSKGLYRNLPFVGVLEPDQD